MSGGGEYPYPKYTWSPAGGWWAKTKNWQRKTGVALVVLVAAAAPLALYSSLNHVKFPAEEQKQQEVTRQETRLAKKETTVLQGK
ncbi:hypothetical protein PRNP1_012256 [Phytophthora ramorum]